MEEGRSKMEEYRQKWSQFQQMIAGKVGKRVFDTWFKDIVMDSYDPEKGVVVLMVPHRYVYEYLEEVRAPLLRQSLDAVFGTGTQLNYRIRKTPVSVPAVEFPPTRQIPRFSIPNGHERLEKGLQHYLGDKARWLQDYDQVADWLTDNKGRGLLCIGTPGLGKTLICEKILPVILGRKIKTVNARDMGAQIDELVKERAVIIDDLGKEPVEYKNYGNVRKPFFELCDAAERNGILLIINTNLSPQVVNNPLYPDSIEHRYGREVLDRLHTIVKAVLFRGDSLRR